MKCLKCGEPLDVEGRAPGSRITCATCGNESTLPSSLGARRALRLILGMGAMALLCPCIGMLAIWLPGQFGFAARPKQNECKTNLKGWFTMQRTRQQGYALPVDTVGFVPERGNRYAYFAGPGPIEDRSGPGAQHGPDAVGYGVDLFRHQSAEPLTFERLPPEVARSVGLSGSQCPEGPDCAITLACIGNIDRDDTLDVWTISTVDRMGPDGEDYTAGEPMPHVDDQKVD